MDLKMLALSLAVLFIFSVALIGFSGSGDNLSEPAILLFEGVSLLAISGATAVGAVLIYDLHRLNVRSIVTNGKQLLLVQYAKDHVVLIDPARISQPTLTLSPSEGKPPQIVHGTEQAQSPFGLPVLTAPLPSIDVLSDAEFQSIFPWKED